VFPAGKEKVVKLVFEGETQMWDRQNRDQSMEINVYKKFGVAINSTNNWGIYRNASIDAAENATGTDYTIDAYKAQNWDATNGYGV
jgi:hypothetical protein